MIWTCVFLKICISLWIIMLYLHLGDFCFYPKRQPFIHTHSHTPSAESTTLGEVSLSGAVRVRRLAQPSGYQSTRTTSWATIALTNYIYFVIYSPYIFYSPFFSPPAVICQPDVLSVSIHCVNQSAVLSWTPVGDVVGYSASAENEAGHMLFCNSSSEPTCTMGGLQCGSQYNFSVQASDGTCNRSISEPVLAGGGTTEMFIHKAYHTMSIITIIIFVFWPKLIGLS